MPSSRLILLFALLAVPTVAKPGELVAIPGGFYKPVLREKDEPERVAVGEFQIEKHPVTNREFLEFVRENPKWRRSAVSRLFADGGYLSHWKSDLEPGDKAPPKAPVVRVSWFAARAYASWKGLRLPTVAEWELAASAGFTRAEGKNDPEMQRLIFDWLDAPSAEPSSDATTGRPDQNGVLHLHGLIWEWVGDFNTAMVTGESRADSGLERTLFCGAGAAGVNGMPDYPVFMRLAFRSSLRADYCLATLGFRCAKTSGPHPK